MSTAALPAHDVTDLGLAAEGRRRIEWAERETPVLRPIREVVAGARPPPALLPPTPPPPKTDVAAALVKEWSIAVFARRGEDRDTYSAHLDAVADTHPHLTMDDGSDLGSLPHTHRLE